MSIIVALKCRASQLTMLRSFARFQMHLPEPATIGAVFYGCVGALDGVAIELLKPPDAYIPRNFFCRKGMYCISAQAVVASACRFLYMSANCVGSAHDSLSFACSRLGQAFRQNGLGPFWIAGDAAYECWNGLIAPWSKDQQLD
jgi:DDE superfamily endonuclease